MKKVKLFSILALSAVVLGACSSLPSQSGSNSDKTEQTDKKEESVKEKVTKDAETLLDAVLTTDIAKFKKIYGETYEKWTEAVFAVQTSEKVKDDGLTPASTYSVQWHADFPIETPEETITGFLKVRRKMFQEIGSYSIKDVKLDESGSSATVTFTSKKLHSKGLASSTRDVLTTLIGGIDNLGKYNTAGSNVDIKRYQTLISYWIFEHLFRHDFTIYNDVDPNLAYTPFTTGDFDTEIKLTKDKDGNWLISQEDYRTLATELIDNTEGYDTVVRSNVSKSNDKGKSSDKSTGNSTDKSSDKKDKSSI